MQSRNFDGTSSYQSGQFRLERRFSDGYSFLATYTVSKFTEQTFTLNAQDGPVSKYEDRRSDVDVPHRVVLNGILELPFGRGRKFGSNWNGFLNALAGGWNVSAIWQWQSGRPLTLIAQQLAYYYNGDINALTADYSGDVDQPVFDVSGFYFDDIPESQRRNDPRIQLAQNYKTLPSRPANLRGQQLNLLDMSVVKRFDITQTVRAQLHFEVYNALNQTFYANPEAQPDQRELRQGHQPEQRAGQPADRRAPVLLMSGSCSAGRPRRRERRTCRGASSAAESGALTHPASARRLARGVPLSQEVPSESTRVPHVHRRHRSRRHRSRLRLGRSARRARPEEAPLRHRRHRRRAASACGAGRCSRSGATPSSSSGCATSTRSGSKLAQKALGVDCPVFTDFDRMVAETRPELLTVTTVDAFHSEYIVKALDRGLDVITEKPMVIDETQCKAVLDAEKRNNRKINVAFNYRFAPKHVKIKELLMAGEIGPVRSVDFHWYLDT